MNKLCNHNQECGHDTAIALLLDIWTIAKIKVKVGISLYYNNKTTWVKTFVWQLVHASAPRGPEVGYPTLPPSHLSEFIVARMHTAKRDGNTEKCFQEPQCTLSLSRELSLKSVSCLELYAA